MTGHIFTAGPLRNWKPRRSGACAESNCNVTSSWSEPSSSGHSMRLQSWPAGSTSEPNRGSPPPLRRRRETSTDSLRATTCRCRPLRRERRSTTQATTAGPLQVVGLVARRVVASPPASLVLHRGSPPAPLLGSAGGVGSVFRRAVPEVFSGRSGGREGAGPSRGDEHSLPNLRGNPIPGRDENSVHADYPHRRDLTLSRSRR